MIVKFYYTTRAIKKMVSVSEGTVDLLRSRKILPPLSHEKRWSYAIAKRVNRAGAHAVFIRSGYSRVYVPYISIGRGTCFHCRSARLRCITLHTWKAHFPLHSAPERSIHSHGFLALFAQLTYV